MGICKPGHQVFQAKLVDRGVPLEVVHTSGHASIADLKRLADAMAPEVLVPVHTFRGRQVSGVIWRECHPAGGWRMVGGLSVTKLQ